MCIVQVALIAALYLRVRQMNCLYFPLQREVSEMAFQQVNSFFTGSETAVQGH